MSIRQKHLITLFVLGLCVLGLALRGYHYWIDRALWLDEAMLALNIRDRTAQELLQPLAYAQGAPVAFLLVQKGIVTVTGANEWALRLFPLLMGSSALLLYYPQTRRYGSRRTALLAVALFALSNFLIYYASEAKQYSVDVFFCVLLFWAGSDLLEQKLSKFAAARFALLASIALGFSHASIFIIASFYLVALAKSLSLRQPGYAARVTLSALLPAACFGLLYFFALRHLAANHTLIEFWDFAFMPVPPWKDGQWVLDTFTRFFTKPVGLANLLSELLFVLGFISLLTRRVDFGAVFLLPFGLTLVASAVRVYPFADRLILFLAPVALYLVSEGVTWLTQWIRPPQVAWVAWVGLAAASVYPFVQIDSQLVRSPYVREHIRPAMEYIEANRQAGDSYYAYVTVYPTFKFYAPAYGVPDTALIEGKYYGQFPDTSLDELQALRGHQRVWVVVARPYQTPTANDETAIVDYLDGLAVRQAEFQQAGVSVYLYEFN